MNKSSNVMAGPMSAVTGAGSMVTGKGAAPAKPGVGPKPMPPASPQPKNVGDYFGQFTRAPQMTAAGAAGVKKADLDIKGKAQDLWSRIRGGNVSRPEAYGKTLLGGAAGGAAGLLGGSGLGLLAGVLASIFSKGKIPMSIAARKGPALGATIGGGAGAILGAGEGAYQAAKKAMALDKLMSTPISAEEILKFAAAKMPAPQGTPEVPPVPRGVPSADPTLNSTYNRVANMMGKAQKRSKK